MVLLGALLFGTAVLANNEVENPRFVSPNGEMCVFIRNEPPEPTRAALYHCWPGGYRQPLAEFALQSEEAFGGVLVADDGHIVTYRPVRCDASAELLTIRAPDGSVVRTLRARDALTSNDQQWLCRGNENDVRFSVGETLRMTMLVTDGRWDDPGARHYAVDIDLATGAVAKPDRNYCPAALLITPEADDGLPRPRIDRDVVPLTSQALLDRAVVRVLPEYPEVAAKARISGRVGVQVVVGRDGNVEAVTIVKPLPFGLDEAARRAILKWEFAPDAARVSGVLAFHFKIVR